MCYCFVQITMCNNYQLIIPSDTYIYCCSNKNWFYCYSFDSNDCYTYLFSYTYTAIVHKPVFVPLSNKGCNTHGHHTTVKEIYVQKNQPSACFIYNTFIYIYSLTNLRMCHYKQVLSGMILTIVHEVPGYPSKLPQRGVTFLE